MLFNFRLLPIETITPWGSGDELQLHWFALTDGCYWLQVGTAELFRYGEQYISEQTIKYSCEPYVNYYVARLWEDLLQLLPNILTPIPQNFAAKLASSGLFAWEQRANHWVDLRDDDKSIEIYMQAVEWLHIRCLGTGYLNRGPRICFWSDGVTIHIEWDNRGPQEKQVAIWDVPVGNWSLTVETFLEEIHALNTQLMETMQTRIESIARGLTYPIASIDFDQLMLEQTCRLKWLEQSLNRSVQGTSDDWSEILQAFTLIEADQPV